MGCTNSKLDDLPAVALCRDRCAVLDEAIRQRYLLSQAHLAYFHSLKTVGASLNTFFHPLQQQHQHQHQHHLPNNKHQPPPPSSSPLLNLPPHSKAVDPPKSHHHSHSHSGSHLHFHSDDDNDSSDDHLHHDSPSSPIHHMYGQLGGYPDTQSFGLGTFVHTNFMRNQTTPSVTYQHRPPTSQILRMGGEASTSYDNDQNPSFYPPPSSNYSTYGGSSTMPYYGSSSAPTVGAELHPPPSPPRASAWEFLNPFESSDKYYPPYTPSRRSRDVREEEGIPDLEEEDYQQEIVKKIHGNHKSVDGSSSGGGNGSYSKVALEEGKGDNSEALYRARPSVGLESDAAEYEVHMMDKKVVDDEERSGNRSNVAGFKTREGRFGGDSEVIREIQVQFERASESGNELAKILEVGKLPYNRKHAAYQASSKMLHSIAPSTSGSADIEKADPTQLDAEGELNLRSRNLSSTLQKLYLWEKKLYEEVKVEEKMRILHERKCRKLKRLDEKGAEALKVDATRAMVRSLSTKIRIAIQVVDKISVTINRLRDEELWPQLHEFIQGLVRMWKSMLECHHNQCQAIVEAKHLDAITNRAHSSEGYIESISQLEHEVINWTVGFSCWIDAQKGYVRALNNWLMKCLLYVPEETPDGIAPFSPGRIGAPPVFVMCNQWSQAFGGVSEKEVLDNMRGFATSVLQLWEQDKLEMQRMTANKDMERKIKNVEREDQKLQKEIQALDKRLVMFAGDDNNLSLSGQVVYQSDTSKSSSLQVGLQRIFEAMERFMANSLKVHEELLRRIEEDLARETENVS
ncbi:hypothetical protein ACH5RR_021850 [Cinchona calisaya]|uniref:Uncharacterized protein n=1 Tax=Cinchona calisaya TaxID=153742 RepID=A0ABD2Z632_9GENT